MSILSTIKKDKDVQEEADVLGGYNALESDLYNMTIELAYIVAPDSGSIGIVFHFKGDKGEALKQTLWVRSGNAKGNKNYWVGKDGKKNYLPGFNQCNAICQLTLNKDLSEIDSEEKVINLYSYEASKEIPTKVEILEDLTGQELKIGLIKQIVDKKSKGDDGGYYSTGETREENDIGKIFDKNGLTHTEREAGETKPVFLDKWVDKFKGTVKDKSTGVNETPGKSKGSSTKTAVVNKPTKSLFEES